MKHLRSRLDLRSEPESTQGQGSSLGSRRAVALSQAAAPPRPHRPCCPGCSAALLARHPRGPPRQRHPVGRGAPTALAVGARRSHWGPRVRGRLRPSPLCWWPGAGDPSPASGSSQIPSDDAGRGGSHSSTSGRLPPRPHGLLTAPPRPGGGWKGSACDLSTGTPTTCAIGPPGRCLTCSLCQELPAPRGKLLLTTQNPISSASCQKPSPDPSSRIQGNTGLPPTLTFPVFEQQLPNVATGSGVHTGCRLIQDNDSGATHKGDGHRQLPLHPTWAGTRARRSA